MSHPAPPARRAARLDAAALTAAVLVFLAPALQPGLQFLSRDSGRMHHPHKAWIAGELARGHLPEWNPYAGLGTPEVAGAVDAVLHPFNLLLVALPFELGFKLWIVLSLVAAALGAWTLARGLGAGRAAAAVAGLAFGLCGHLVSSTDNAQYLTAAAFAPWLAAALIAFGRGGRARALLGVLAAAYLVMAAGDPISFAVPALLGSAAAWRLPADAPAGRRGLRAAVGLLVALLGAAPALVPLALWVPHSSRGEPLDWIEHARFSLLWSRVPELMLPGLFRAPEIGLRSPLYLAYAGDPYTPIPWVLSIYLGASALALAVAGAARRPLGRLLLLLAAATLWAALGRYGGFGQLARGLPGLATLRYWEKLAVWIPLFVALAAALGVDAVAADAAARRRLALGSAAAGLALALLAGLAALAPGPLARLLAPPTGDLAQAAVLTANLARGAAHAAAALLALAAAAGLGERTRLGAGPLLALVVGADLAVGGAGAILLSPVEIARPASPLADHLRAADPLPRVVTPFSIPEPRVPGLEPHEAAWWWGARSAYSGWAVERGVANFEIYSGVVPVRAARYRRRAGLVKQLPGVGLWGVAFAVVPEPPERAAEMNLPGPYRVAARDPLLGTALLELRHRPRAYLASRLRAVDRRAAMEFALDDASVTTDVTVLEGEVPPGLEPPSGEAAVVEDAGEQVTVATRSDRAALLVLNDVFAEGWSATVDGQPAAILPANYLARGVWVPAGEHRVRFAYRTPGLREGALLLLAGLLVVAGWAWRDRRAGATATPGEAA